MGHFKKAFPGKYLQTADLDTPIVATIGSVKMETVGIGTDAETKPVAHFIEPGIKSLVLNLTKCEAIADIANSEDTDHWVNVRITLSQGTTKYQGKKVGCIVVSAAAKRDQARKPAAQTDDIDDTMQPLKAEAF